MRMFEGLIMRVEQRAGAVTDRALDRVKQAVADCPGIAVHRKADRIILSGRLLTRRWLDDVRLRLAMRGQR